MASSRLIAAGENYTPDDINNLRADVLDATGGHKHNGVDGARVPFANLDVAGAAGSTAPPGGSKSYNDLANHVASSQGAHGLNALAHVIGGASSGLLIQTGTFSPNLSGSPNGSGTGVIAFPIAFSSTPVVFFGWNGNSPNGWAQISTITLDANGFTWWASASNDGGHFYMTSASWFAIGAKTP